MTRSHDALQSVWNRWWGGYDGKTPFDWWHENPIPQNTPEEYVERGIMYFAITDEDLRTGYSNANRAVKDFVEQLVHVKTIPAGAPDVRGPTIHFYRMVPPAVAANITFDGRITLIGYDTNAAHLTPEDTLAIRPYWRVTDVPRSNYSLFVHLYRQGDDQIITQYDGPPAQMQRPTLTWTDLDELYIGSEISLNLPETLEPGDYRLMMGLYDYLTGERLLLENGADAHAIEFSLASP